MNLNGLKSHTSLGWDAWCKLFQLLSLSRLSTIKWFLKHLNLHDYAFFVASLQTWGNLQTENIVWIILLLLHTPH